MKLRNPWLIRLVGLLGAWFIRGWMGTVRYRFHRDCQEVDPGNPRVTDHYIYAFWHDSMLFPAAWKSKAPMLALISQHADGELIAQILRHLGFQAVRGSSTRGGVEAIRQIVRRRRRGHLSVTPDGPRGPRRRVQPGIVYLASKTGMPIVPVGIGFQNAWRARSWDRFAVPKPYSSATCVITPVVRIPPDLDREMLEAYRQLVEQRLLEATAAAENWAQRSGRRECEIPETHR